MPVVIDSSLTNPDHPRICYNNLAAGAGVTLTASTEASTSFAKENVVDPATWNFWQPSSQNSYIDVDFGTGTAVNYIAIRGHNCGTQGNVVNIQYSDNASPESFTTIDTHTPTDDSIILFLFATETRQKFRIEFTGGSVPTVGNIWVGTQLVMPQQIYGGHTPIIFAKKTVVRPTRSETGQYLGRSLVRQGVVLQADFTHLTASWVRANLEDFINDAATKPFFFAWRPTTYVEEICYIFTGDDLSASNMGVKDLMQFSLSGGGRID